WKTNLCSTFPAGERAAGRTWADRYRLKLALPATIAAAVALQKTPGDCIRSKTRGSNSISFCGMFLASSRDPSLTLSAVGELSRGEDVDICAKDRSCVALHSVRHAST